MTPRVAAGGGLRHRAAHGAGPELSVAATKTFVASLAGVAAAGGGVDRRPACSQPRSIVCRIGWPPPSMLDWSAALDALSASSSLVTIGRGPTLGHRPRSRAQAEGDLQPACRGLQRRGIPAWPGRSGLRALSGPDVHADRRGGAGPARARGRSAPAKAHRCSLPSTGSRWRAGCPRSRPSHAG